MTDTVKKLILADSDSVESFMAMQETAIAVHCDGYGQITACAKILAVAVIAVGTEADSDEIGALSDILNDADEGYEQGNQPCRFATYRKALREYTKKSGIVLNAYATNDQVGFRYPIESIHLESCTPTTTAIARKKAKSKGKGKGKEKTDSGTDNQNNFPIRDGEGNIDIDKHVRTVLQNKDIDFNVFLSALFATQTEAVVIDTMRYFGFVPMVQSVGVLQAVAADIDTAEAADIVAAKDKLARQEAEAAKAADRRATTIERETAEAAAKAAEAAAKKGMETVALTEAEAAAKTAEAEAAEAVKVAKAAAIVATTGKGNRRQAKGNTRKTG